MAFIGEWIRRLNYLLRRGAMDEELRREMESHRAQLGDAKSFGNTLRLRDEARDAWGWRWLEDFVQDMRFAARTLRRSPGFALTAVVTLALGIGVNIGMFTFVNALLLRPVYATPRRSGGAVTAAAQRLTGEAAGSPTRTTSISRKERPPSSRTSRPFPPTSWVWMRATARDARWRPRVTANYFEIFGLPLTRGRVFTTEETQRGNESGVAILSYSFWEQRGADPAMLGRTVRINGEPFTVIGVAAKGFTGMGIPGPEVWTPLGEPARTRRACPRRGRTAHSRHLD